MAAERKGQVVVGTSSWADPGFVEEWYPPGMAARDRLGWYAQRFEAVEVNSSFYAIPAEQTVKRWVAVTPEDFTFDVKLHRLLSRHSAPVESLPPDLRGDVRTSGRGRVLLEPGIEREVAARAVEAMAPLAEAGRLSSFLLQLTPAFKPGAHALDELRPLVEAVAPTPLAIELRHRGWVEGEQLERTLDFYDDAGVAFVCVDSPPGDAPTLMPPVDAVTRDDLAYVRLHGRNTEGYLSGKTVAERFAWDYSDEELEGVRARVQELAGPARDVRVMFNNNRGRDAPDAARRMRELLGQDPGPPPEPDQQTLL